MADLVKFGGGRDDLHIPFDAALQNPISATVIPTFTTTPTPLSNTTDNNLTTSVAGTATVAQLGTRSPGIKWEFASFSDRLSFKFLAHSPTLATMRVYVSDDDINYTEVYTGTPVGETTVNLTDLPTYKYVIGAFYENSTWGGTAQITWYECWRAAI